MIRPRRTTALLALVPLLGLAVALLFRLLALTVPTIPELAPDDVVLRPTLALVSDSSLARFIPEPLPLSTAEIVNPLRGLYHWRGQETVPQPQPALDAYDRYEWADLEPRPGVYDFTAIDQAIAKATSEGRRFGFRVRALVGEQGSSVPTWLMGRMKRGWWHDVSGDGTYDTYVPDWNDPAFVQGATALVAALGSRYEGHPQVAFVENGMYGVWGEWNMWRYPYPNGAGTERMTLANKQALVDAYIAAFPTTPLVMMTDDADALVYAMERSPRIGWRRDSLGDEYFGSIKHDERRWNAIKDRWKSALVITELINPSQQTDPDSYLQAIEQVREFRVSMVGNGNTLPWRTLSQQGREALERLGKVAGYRLMLNELALPKRLVVGVPFDVRTSWSNLGSAPLYEPWEVTIQLRHRGSAAVAWEARSGIALAQVLPLGGDGASGPTMQVDQLVVPALANGIYDLAVVVSHPQGRRAPLALALGGQAADGSYLLGQVEVATGP